jgi:hypothetical protein
MQFRCPLRVVIPFIVRRGRPVERLCANTITEDRTFVAVFTGFFESGPIASESSAQKTCADGKNLV